MIVETTDPLGTEYAVVRPGGSIFTYESENSFSAGWSVILWINYSDWSSQEERVITLEDIDDSDNDLRITLYNNGADNAIKIGDSIEYTPVFLNTPGWHIFCITSIPGSTDVFYSLDSIEAVRSPLSKVPLNSRINIGGSPDRYFRGNMFDIRVYDKAVSSRSGNVLYDDAINNQGNKTVPL